MRRFILAYSALTLSFFTIAEAQPFNQSAGQSKTNTDVVASAGDAFGISLGPETLGLYNSSNVRGFSPLIAGNARIDGLYFDQQGSMIDPLVTDTRIRVGLSAVNFPWPAPSGIVDYTLRQPKDDAPKLTSIFYVGPYGSRDADLNGYTRLPEKGLSVSAGMSYHGDEPIPGDTGRVVSFGILPRWTPAQNVSIRGFWGRQNTIEFRPAPFVYLGPAQIPPYVPTRFYGTPWALISSYYEHYGLLADLPIAKHWSLRMGIFRSIYAAPRSFADLYLNTTSEAIAEHVLVAEPNQYYGSTSGEFLLDYQLESGSWSQKLVIGMRGRSLNAQYGGGTTYDYGESVLGRSQNAVAPLHNFEPTSTNHIREYSSGASYTVEWRDHLNFTAAVRQTHYSDEVENPDSTHSETSIRPWLYNASLALFPINTLTVFGTFTRGLEDSGVAPADSVNRGQVLGAARSSQSEVGFKYRIAPELNLLMSAFDIEKPYFALDSHDFFRSLGQETHRGVEISLAGQVNPDLHVVAGVVLMSPEVTATSTTEQIIGIRPIGQADRVEQLALDYHVRRFPALSLDGVLNVIGNRVASTDNRTRIPSYATLDIGARYEMHSGQHPITLRIQVLNITNSLNWAVDTDGALEALPPRRAWAYVIIDL